ncbi:MAG: sigma factor-like helix-turn-helix DNA-binding protein [Solirubrobacteraceae bacterium]
MGLSYQEAARALGLREGTLTSRLHRARRRIADLLDPP